MLSQVRRLFRLMRHRRLHKPDLKVSHVVIGTDYGGWPIIPAILPKRPLIYSVGVGEDISFDLGMIEQFDAVVHAFDPTPRSLEWIGEQSLPAAFNYHPIGLGGENARVPFFPPANDAHVSFSNAPGDAQNCEPFMAEVCTLEAIMQRLGHERIDVLKMDIEGFEYQVIETFQRGAYLPEFILVEFHHGMYQATDADTNTADEHLRKLGYDLFYVSPAGREYGYVKHGIAAQNGKTC